MNGDAFQRARPGAALTISAAAWNACLDAADAHKRGPRGNNGGPVQFRQADIVLVKNASGDDVPRFGVLGIDGVIITPDDSLIEFQNQVAFRGITPTTDDHTGKFVVCLDPLGDGQIGRAWVSGVCNVQVNVVAETDNFCDVKNNDRTMLRSSSSGTARILYRESAGAGTKWCVVRMGDAKGGTLRIGKVTSAWTIGTCATVDIWQRGESCTPTEADPAETVEDVVNLSHDVPADSWVIIAQDTNGKWCLVESGRDEGSCRQTIGGQDITKWPGWNGTNVQLLGHDENGCLKWFDSEECQTPSPGTP